MHDSIRALWMLRGVEPGGAMVELLTRNSVGNHERTRNRPAELPKHRETSEIRPTP